MKKNTELEIAEHFIANHNVSDEDMKQDIYVIALSYRENNTHSYASVYNKIRRYYHSYLDSDIPRYDLNIDDVDYQYECTDPYVLVEQKELSDTIDKFIKAIIESDKLSPIKRKILIERFGLYGGSPKSIKQISEICGLSRYHTERAYLEIMARLHRPEFLKQLKDQLKTFGY